VYDGVVNDLLRYWSHLDTEQELQQYVQGVLYLRGKRNLWLPEGLVAELVTVRSF
jgi:hypothetical protein